jgi:hypothetical protein
VPYEKIKVVAGDDACEAGVFRVLNYNIVGSEYPYQFYSPEKDIMVTADNMAFDHAIIIKDSLKRIYGRRDYCNDLFYLLSNPDSFTVNDYKSFYEKFGVRIVDWGDIIPCDPQVFANYNKRIFDYLDETFGVEWRSTEWLQILKTVEGFNYWRP